MRREIDVVISTRIRFARNIKDYPFHAKLDKTSALEIIGKAASALGEEYVKTDFDDISVTKAKALVEKHRVSPEFVNSVMPHALFEKEDIAIMVCEEDHIRLQVIKEGFELEEAYKEARGVDDLLRSKLNIAYSNELGYLTHCPTNLGSGMRASVMLFLPGLSITGELPSLISQLTKLGVTVRGIYGEGSESSGYIYQISNRETLGVCDTDMLKKLGEIIVQIVSYERKARERIKESGIKTEDAISRAMGTLLYSKLVSSEEFITLYAKVRLGVAVGIINSIDYETLDKLFVDVMPANLTLIKGELAPEDRDRERAEYIKNVLK